MSVTGTRKARRAGTTEARRAGTSTGSRRRRSGAVLGMVSTVLVLTGCTANLQHLPLGRSPGGDTYPLTFTFSDSSLLPLGGQVRLGQSVVGLVSDVHADRFDAVVSAQMKSSVVLPAGTTAEIQLNTPIGDGFINLTPPDNPDGATIPAGATLDLAHTSRGPDVAQLLGVIGTFLNGSGIAQIQGIVRDSNSLLSGRETTVRDLLTRTNDVLGTFDARQASINQAISSLDTLSTTLNNEKDTLDSGVRALTPAINVLDDDRGSLLSLLEQVRGLSAQVDDVLNHSSGQITDVVTQLRPILDQLTATGPTLSDTTAKLAGTRDLLNRTVHGDYASIDINVPIIEAAQSLLNQVLPGLVPPVPQAPLRRAPRASDSTRWPASARS